MLRQERTEVLVVGAGPVGMLTALLLSRGGVRVRIIDQEWRTASRTYACALHPRTLQLLDGVGLASEVLDSGRRVGTVAFYESASRRAEAKLAQVSSPFPFVLVLAQSAFEKLLEETLRKEAGVEVEWNHRLSGLRPEADSAVAVVDKLGVSAKGYIVPEMEWSVERTDEIRASYIIGADGTNSSVARCLGTSYHAAGEPEFFAVYEIQSDWAGGEELRVVLDGATTSVLWPLPGNKFRWSFQLRQEHLTDFPSKERTSLLIDQPALDAANRQFIQKLVRERAPWFTGAIQELGWSTDVEFGPRCATRFGQQRAWLVGDAGHQTGPAGMQSMNLGMLEAAQLSAILVKILRDKASGELLESYNDDCGKSWRRLLGIDGTPRLRPATDAWVKGRRTRILPCLPASGEDLVHLLNQLQLDFA
jgi:2-polyprenyl-6-methoxyphenol hydroxylase-like FAD-dependent oxidoreductase